MTQVTTQLPQTILEKLARASSVEEVKAVLATSQLILKEMNMPGTGDGDQDSIGDETPNQAYHRFRKEFEHLEDHAIGRIDAAKKYGVTEGAIRGWEEKGSVRVIQPAKRRGMPTLVSERDVATMARVVKKFQNKSGPIKGWKPPVITQNG